MSSEVSASTEGSAQIVAENEINTPNDTTLQYCAKCAIQEDKPVLFDYWADSCEKKCCIGIREEDKEKILVKGSDEYTSPISRIFQVENNFIIVTCNSIYVVSSDIEIRAVEFPDE